MSNFKKADTTSQWFQDDYPGSLMNLTAANMVCVIHTTETMGWPGYEGGRTAPNYTGFGPLKGISSGKWRAHFPDERSSRALRNLSGGVETNTLNSVQIELIGTCDPKHAKSWNGEGKKFAGKDYIYWPKASAGQLKWLAGLLADLHLRHGLRLAAPRFVAYPTSYGNGGGQRFSFTAWRAFAGVCGHQHVPENMHGDPGNIPIGTALTYAKEMVAPVSATRLRVLNWPLKVTMPEASARRSMKELLAKKKPDVATFTEVDFMIGVPDGYRGYRTNSTLHDQTTVMLISKKLKVIKHGYALMTEPWVGPQGNKKKPRAYPWALVEKNGKRFWVGAIHMPADRKGSPARVESDQWATSFMNHTGRVVLSGDYNYKGSMTGQRVLGVGIVHAEYKGCTADGLQPLGYNGSDHMAYAMGFLA